MTNTKSAKSAAPSTPILLRPSTLLLAAALALEAFGANALAHSHGLVATTAAADGDTIYIQTASVEVSIVAEATIPAR